MLGRLVAAAAVSALVLVPAVPAQAGPSASCSASVSDGVLSVTGTASGSWVYPSVEPYGTYGARVVGGAWELAPLTAPAPGSYTVVVSGSKSGGKALATCSYSVV